ncbi:hypothetical protein JHK85_023548 [Glycine max]|nr:hypothetical protein JHK85_023548 [Glycine max]
MKNHGPPLVTISQIAFDGMTLRGARVRNRERSREIREKSVRNIEKREERRWVVSCFANVIIFLSEVVAVSHSLHAASARTGPKWFNDKKEASSQGLCTSHLQSCRLGYRLNASYCVKGFGFLIGWFKEAFREKS